MKRASRNFAFTLLEMLVATVLAVIIGLLLVSIMGRLGNVWVRSNAKMASLQGGRAIVDFISRDARALEPPKTSTRVSGDAFFSQIGDVALDPRPYAYLQFLIDAGRASDGLASYMPAGRKVAPGSGNFFGQFRGEPTPNGDLWIVGYYLADDADGVRRLYRVLVAPDAADGVYKLFTNFFGVQAGNPTANSWLYDNRVFQDWDPEKRYGAAAMADHVAAFWVEALDAAGAPIPWLSGAATAHGDQASAPLKFDSAAHFQMARGTALKSLLDQGKPSFRYLDHASTSTGLLETLPAHELPAALRITLISTDDTYARRKFTLPDPPQLTAAGQVPDKAAEYRVALYDAGLRQAGLFTSTVELAAKDGI